MKYRHILLIDDDEDDGEIFVAALKVASAAVAYTVLDDATEALDQLSSKEIIPDVIFLDLNMPIMNGQQFLLEVKKNQGLQNIPVVIFSTTSHSPTIQLTKEFGAQDFITKPNNFDELVHVLKNFLNERHAE
ncbi:MAG: response regulator [Chitinophagaceae bacterium]|nr:response regulator [Chitinophagaceae bacterium]